MPDWRAVLDIVRPNSVSRACAVLSIATIGLPWLVLKWWTVIYPTDYWINIGAPEGFYSLARMAAGFFDPSFGLPDLLSIAALVFIAGAIISWWSPVGGILQVESAYVIAIALARYNDSMVPIRIDLEYGLGIGFHIGFMFALVTVFSLCPSGRSALIRAFRIAFRRVRPQPA